MAASPSIQKITAVSARRARQFARANGGVARGPHARGVKDGLAWTYGDRILRASNGEVALDPAIVIAPVGKAGQSRQYAFADLETALLAFRLETADPLCDSDLFEGRPGDYKRLIGRRNPFVQTWGFRFAIGLNLDAGGFDLFQPDGRTLPFRGEAADFWARDLWLNLPLMGAWADRLTLPRAQRIAHAEAVDHFCGQFVDEPAWTYTADWRAKPDHYVTESRLPRA